MLPEPMTNVFYILDCILDCILDYILGIVDAADDFEYLTLHE